MDLKGLEGYLTSNKVGYKASADGTGLLINLGFLVGRVHVQYDKQLNVFDFNDRARWTIEILLLALMVFFLSTNLGFYSEFQLYLCIGLTFAMLAIFGVKESRIKRLKLAIAEQAGS